MKNKQNRSMLIEQLPNVTLVQEVFDLVESGTLLRGDAAAATRVVEEGVASLVDSYDDALGMALSQEVRFRYFMSGNGGQLREASWSNIIEDELGKVFGTLGNLKLMDTFYSVAGFGASNNFFKVVEANFPDQYGDDLADDVCSVMGGCIASRMASGRDNLFYERIFRVYQLGGWACGWDDDNQRPYANFPEAQ